MEPSHDDPPSIAVSPTLAALWEAAVTPVCPAPKAIRVNGVLRDTTAPPLPEYLPEGERHNHLRTLGGRLRRAGLTEDEIYNTFVATRDARSDDAASLPDTELRALADWFGSKEPGGDW